MKISKLKKEANYIQDKVKITVEIEIPNQSLRNYGYKGLDMISDEVIPDILIAIGRMYSGRIRNGRIIREKVGRLF